MAQNTDRRRGTPRKAKGVPKVSQAQAQDTARASQRKPRTRSQASKKASGTSARGTSAYRSPSEARAERLRRANHGTVDVKKTIRRVCIGLVAFMVVGLVAFFVLKNSSVFAITNITVDPTDHITNEDIQKLVAVPEGTTLLNMDEKQITENLKEDPWVATVSFERQFPNTLHITITEHKVAALVVPSAGSSAWYLSDEGTWLQKVDLSVGENSSLSAAALAQAEKDGVLLVSDVPATVNPVAGAPATDEVIKAVLTYQSTFTSELTSQIVSYSAASSDSINITLTNGIQVALGSPTQIEDKEKVILRMIEQYAGEMTYLNVRVPSSPTYRRVAGGNTQNGTGISTTSTSTNQSESASREEQGEKTSQTEEETSQTKKTEAEQQSSSQ